MGIDKRGVQERDDLSLSLLKRVGKKAIKFSVIGILAILILNVDKAVLSHFLSVAELGYYCFSWTLVTGVLNLSSILIMIFGPRFSHYIALGQKRADLYLPSGLSMDVAAHYPGDGGHSLFF